MASSLSMNTYLQQVENIWALQKVESITRFDDLSDELILMMCHYLTPVDVIKAFYDYSCRLFRCIDRYRKHINLTRCSYNDFQYFMEQFRSKRLLPSTLIVSNAFVSSQIDNLIKVYDNRKSNFGLYVDHLSLLDCS
jgi:hypothetical protein